MSTISNNKPRQQATHKKEGRKCGGSERHRRERERDREGERERATERATERETERQRQRDGEITKRIV